MTNSLTRQGCYSRSAVCASDSRRRNRINYGHCSLLTCSPTHHSAHSTVIHFLLHTANASERLTDGRSDSSWRTDKTADWKRSGDGGNGSNEGGRRWLGGKEGRAAAGPGGNRYSSDAAGRGSGAGGRARIPGAEPDSSAATAGATGRRDAARASQNASRVRQTQSAAAWPQRSKSNPMINGEMGRICGNVIRRALSAPQTTIPDRTAIALQ